MSKLNFRFEGAALGGAGIYLYDMAGSIVIEGTGTIHVNTPISYMRYLGVQAVPSSMDLAPGPYFIAFPQPPLGGVASLSIAYANPGSAFSHTAGSFVRGGVMAISIVPDRDTEVAVRIDR